MGILTCFSGVWGQVCRPLEASCFLRDVRRSLLPGHQTSPQSLQTQFQLPKRPPYLKTLCLRICSSFIIHEMGFCILKSIVLGVDSWSLHGPEDWDKLLCSTIKNNNSALGWPFSGSGPQGWNSARWPGTPALSLQAQAHSLSIAVLLQGKKLSGPLWGTFGHQERVGDGASEALLSGLPG